jgi:predicted ATPase/DNA-binding winged helix-turn-helix (wHTH) protein
MQQQLILTSGALEIDPVRRELRIEGQPRAMPARAFEILLLLARAAGQLVSKDEVISRVWRGATVGDNVLQVHVAAIRKALGPERGRIETNYGRGYRLLGAWNVETQGTVGPASAPAAIAASVRKWNLPPAGLPLIARESVLDRVSQIVATHRLVTLTGTGGIGKTRLAIEAARRLAPNFREGVCLVELGPLADARLVPQAVANVLGQPLTGKETDAEDVAALLGAGRQMLLLDNCEHLLNAAAALAETLLWRCPELRILATSREMLGARDERVYRVPPLDVPADTLAGNSELGRHGAVRLFLDRMAAADTDAPADDLAPVAQICRRLDGIPLAIEFAAARAAMLGPREVAARLDRRLDLLGVGRRTTLPRHATLHATLDWSHELLEETERKVFRRLACFSGGFVLDAARFVVSDADLGEAEVDDAVAGLVAKSLLNFTAAPAPRWHFLETTRAFAQQKLGEAGEAAAAFDRHAAWMRCRMRAIWRAGAPQPEDVAEGARELDNARAAMDWLFQPGGDAADGAALVADFVPVWLQLGLAFECHQRVERSLAALAEAGVCRPGLRVRLLATLIMTLQRVSAPGARSDDVLAELTRMKPEAAEPEAWLFAFWAMWNYHANADQHHAALENAKAFAALAAGSGALVHQVVAHNMLGYECHHRGQHRKAAHHLAEARRLAEQEASGGPLVWMHYEQRIYTAAVLAAVQWQLGQLDDALRTARAALDAAVASGAGISVCVATFIAMAPISLSAGDVAAAEAALTLAREIAEARRMAFACTIIDCFRGAAKAAAGAPESGAALLETTLQTLRQLRRTTYFGYFLAQQATALLACGDYAEAEELLAEAIQHANTSGEAWIMPELMRLQGECLLASARPDLVAIAKMHLLAALDLAHRHGAAFWALRAARSLVKLPGHEAHTAMALLAAACDGIHGGSGWPDLESARALLGEKGATGDT